MTHKKNGEREKIKKLEDEKHTGEGESHNDKNNF